MKFLVFQKFGTYKCSILVGSGLAQSALKPDVQKNWDSRLVTGHGLRFCVLEAHRERFFGLKKQGWKLNDSQYSCLWDCSVKSKACLLGKVKQFKAFLDLRAIESCSRRVNDNPWAWLLVRYAKCCDSWFSPRSFCSITVQLVEPLKK